MTLDRHLQRVWYGRRSIAFFLLLPLSWLFGFISAMRRAAFRSGLFKNVRVDKPVIVIGNITVGGTGKTPFTIWLANRLTARGLRVGIVLRGYGGTSARWPRRVTPDTSWQEVGDEALLLAMQASAIVIAGPDRVENARLAIAEGAQIVLSDDGLQHYRLHRDVEIVVIDEQRKLGNGHLLPAGPLREPARRCAQAHLRVITRRRRIAQPSQVTFEFGSPAVISNNVLSFATNLHNGSERALAEFKGRRVHAVAAIGHPESFFRGLRDLGLEIVEHPYPDHATLSREDIMFEDDAPVLMTEKDAVKCRLIADERHWGAALRVELSDADDATIVALLQRFL